MLLANLGGKMMLACARAARSAGIAHVELASAAHQGGSPGIVTSASPVATTADTTPAMASVTFNCRQINVTDVNG